MHSIRLLAVEVNGHFPLDSLAVQVIMPIQRLF